MQKLSFDLNYIEFFLMIFTTYVSFAISFLAYFFIILYLFQSKKANRCQYTLHNEAFILINFFKQKKYTKSFVTF